MTINGTDHTLIVFVAAHFLFLLAAEFLLCRWSRRKWVRGLPLGYIVWILLAGIAALYGDAGGFVDLRFLAFGLLCAYAAICSAGILVGWLLGRGNQK